MIKNGKVVDLSYSLKNSEGEVLDESTTAEPFSYLHGAQQIVPGLENALSGLKVGDKKEVTVPPADGYGEINPGLKMVVKRAQFPKGVELEEGMSFEASGSEGEEGGMMFMIESIEGDDIHLDGNHPLAGETLHFSVQVLSIRDATEEEKSHGHAHGPEGHGHGHDHSHGHEHGHEHGESCGHDHGHGHGHGDDDDGSQGGQGFLH